MTRKGQATLVVIGNGMVAYKLCEYLVESRAGRHYRIVCFGEEPRPAYDRVNLTTYLSASSADALLLTSTAWYGSHGIELHLGDPVLSVDRAAHCVRSARGCTIDYNRLVFATGSAPFLPPVEGIDLPGIFPYRTIDHLDAIRAYAAKGRSAAVLGGGLLGLEAAKALHDLGLQTHVVEFAPTLMARQLDREAASLLAGKIERLGVHVHLGRRTERITARGKQRVLHFADGSSLAVDLIVVSAGVRPRDELARSCGLALGPGGGIAVDDTLCSSDSNIFAIGECASHEGTVYGLLAPGQRMADVLACRIAGKDRRFTGADLSTRLKLMGVDVASIGQPTEAETPDSTYITLRDDFAQTYRKLVINRSTGVLRGAILVGDSSSYPQLLEAFRSARRLPEPPVSLMVQGGELATAESIDALGEEALLCTCNNVTKGYITRAIAAGCHSLEDVKKSTQAATTCGGCAPQLRHLLATELRRQGVELRKSICEHFPLRRQELFHAVKIHHRRNFDEVLRHHGRGTSGCELCKPVVASILASLYNEPAIEHQVIQDTNDRFLANIQRGGIYSVVPRIPAGEITPEKLILLGQVAKKYALYVKITGAQRIDLFGARVEELPEIWEEMLRAGFESGHAYAKGMRTVKSCVGSSWCRYGLLDSVGLAIRIENRYKGLRSPHKLKAAVSGCIRECAEARSKDFGIVATASGWNLYVCGNAGAEPKQGQLLAAGLDADTCIKYLDRFLMFYIRTADPLTRTARWIEELEGGIEYLRDVILNDRLHLCRQLEAEMQALVDAYSCEWAAVVNDPDKRARFRAFANVPGGDSSIAFVSTRGQKRPASGGGGLLRDEADGQIAQGQAHA